jgi:hypothetical protein
VQSWSSSWTCYCGHALLLFVTHSDPAGNSLDYPTSLAIFIRERNVCKHSFEQLDTDYPGCKEISPRYLNVQTCSRCTEVPLSLSTIIVYMGHGRKAPHILNLGPNQR